jgi:Leucine-rich repeat (LRR) protein
MANISLTNPQNVKSVLLSSSPKLGGSIDISVFSTLETFSCENNEIVSFKGNNVIASLKTLNVSYNNLVSQLEAVNNNVNLETFKFNNNSLTGTIPDITNCSSLIELSGGQNQLTGALPNTFNCPVIERIYLNDNLLSGLASSQIIEINPNGGSGDFAEGDTIYQLVDGIRISGTIAKIVDVSASLKQLYVINITDDDAGDLLFSSGSDYTDIYAGSGEVGIAKTFTITWTGTKFEVDGAETATLNLKRNKIYRFLYPAGQEFAFSTTIDGIHNGGVKFTDGITQSINEFTFIVPDDCPETLYYYNVTTADGGDGALFADTITGEYVTVYNSVTSYTTNVPIINESIQECYIQNNSIIEDLSDIFQTSYNGTPALQDFRCNDNSITGTIPNLSTFASLSYFDCSSNNIANFSGSVTSILTYFNATNNDLNQTAVDNLLAAFDAAGQSSGTLLLSGGTNDAPTGGATNANYLSLLSKGWTVTIN